MRDMSRRFSLTACVLACVLTCLLANVHTYVLAYVRTLRCHATGPAKELGADEKPSMSDDAEQARKAAVAALVARCKKSSPIGANP